MAFFPYISGFFSYGENESKWKNYLIGIVKLTCLHQKIYNNRVSQPVILNFFNKKKKNFYNLEEKFYLFFLSKLHLKCCTWNVALFKGNGFLFPYISGFFSYGKNKSKWKNYLIEIVKLACLHQKIHNNTVTQPEAFNWTFQLL